ncbi:MAG: hypothetical protein OEQ74_04545 [Gammaproteobacteria bacterium]|nr:hypothetical protein [Gammaproteobacteria bacterium]
MIRRLSRIAPWQAGKVAAVLYFLFGLLFAIPFALMNMFVDPAPGQIQGSLAFTIAIPIFYGLAGLIFVPFGCWVYNLVAKWVGGLEFTVEGG